MNKFYTFAVFLSAFFITAAHGQFSSSSIIVEDTISLEERLIELGEVRVSSLRVNRKVREVPVSMTVVNAHQYQCQSAMTLSNVLASEPCIAMGSDGAWATNIHIRGLNENRLVTLIDGHRVETANDLTASFSMIDVNDVERVEVIKGAQSSLYGTGAMGGIVNIITKDGSFAEKQYLSGNVITGYASASDNYSGHAALTGGSEKWYFRASGAYNHSDDIRTPEGDMPNSRFTTNNISFKAGIRPRSNHLFKLQYQRNWGTNVGIPGGDAFPGPAKATYTDIGRHLLSAGYEITGITDKLTSLRFNYFTQYILREVAMQPNTVTQVTLANGNIQRTTPVLVSPTGNHLTNGTQLQSTWQLSGSNTFIAGVDVWARRLTTERIKEITVELLSPAEELLKTNTIVRGETPIPESLFGSAGLFFQDEARLLNDKLTLMAGGRFDGVWVKNEPGYDVDYLITNGTFNDSPATRRTTFEKGHQQSVSWSANTGLLYRFNKNTDVSLNLARSFRAPSLEELFKYIDLGNYVRLGNTDLEPESGYGADLGFRVWSKKFMMQASVFANHLNNMIVEAPGEFIYSLTSDNTTDTLPAFVNSNVSKALLYGTDFKLQYNAIGNLVLFCSGSYVRGKDTEAEENLPQIPPFYGRLGFRYTWPAIGTVELTVVGADKQAKVAVNETDTDGYVRFDLSLNTVRFNLGNIKLQGFAGIDNITDVSYTNHLSTNRGSISIEPGRNVYLRMNLLF
ncbi:MAG: TonB-dependent receptor [Bacteroidales bacterium]|nr:TonB-dependent receptor [Bacteroidales bacterium]